MTADDIDLKPLNRDELKTLRKQVDHAIEDREKQERQEAVAAVEKVAKDYGISLSELLKGKVATQGSGKKAARPPRYRHPENPEVTWSGFGRQPAWVREHIEAGGSKEDLAIK